jgi:hypothetical protein
LLRRPVESKADRSLSTQVYAKIIEKKQIQFVNSMSAPRPAAEQPSADDYNAWQAWAIELLRQYADYAALHAKNVHALLTWRQCENV